MSAILQLQPCKRHSSLFSPTCLISSHACPSLSSLGLVCLISLSMSVRLCSLAVSRPVSPSFHPLLYRALACKASLLTLHWCCEPHSQMQHKHTCCSTSGRALALSSVSAGAPRSDTAASVSATCSVGRTSACALETTCGDARKQEI